MARSFTIATLIARAKQRAGMGIGTTSTSSFLDDTEWQANLSTAYAELASILMASGMRYFESQDTITTTGAVGYPLPADYLSTIGVDYQVSSAGSRRDLIELMAQERNALRGISGSGEATAYAIEGSGATALRLYPTPPSGQTYYHIYVPQPTDYSASATSTTIDVVTPDGENFLLWSLALIALAKEEADVTVAMTERERMRGRIEEWATLRSINAPRRRIVDENLRRFEDGEWRPY